MNSVERYCIKLNKKKNFFEWLSVLLAGMIIARTFMPILNITISGVAFESLFGAWFCISIIAYKSRLVIQRGEVLLFAFPFIFIMYILFCNVLDGSIIATDFTVVLNFCIPIYFYIIYSHNSPKVLYQLSKLILLLYAVTSITTIHQLQSENFYARMLTGANEHNVETWLKNIGNINFISSSIIVIPFLFYLVFKTKQRTSVKAFEIVLVIVFSFMVYKASFSIIVLCVGLGIILVFTTNRITKSITILCWISLFLFRYDILDFLISVSGNLNEVYSHRVLELSNFLIGNSAYGDFESRLNLYGKSIEFFAQHPLFGLGTGEYFNRTGSIGYHSELFDSLARYGLVMFIPIIIYFSKAFKKVKENIKKRENRRIVNISIILFVVYSSTNPIFTSYPFSYILFTLVPSVDFFMGVEKKNPRSLER